MSVQKFSTSVCGCRGRKVQGFWLGRYRWARTVRLQPDGMKTLLPHSGLDKSSRASEETEGMIG